MAERTLEIVPYAGHVTQILRLAVAQVQPGEDAENLAGALGGERDVELDELAGVEIGLGAGAPTQVAAEQRQLDLRRDVDPRILQQRGEIVGRRSHHRVLEVE